MAYACLHGYSKQHRTTVLSEVYIKNINSHNDHQKHNLATFCLICYTCRHNYVRSYIAHGKKWLLELSVYIEAVQMQNAAIACHPKPHSSTMGLDISLIP